MFETLILSYETVIISPVSQDSTGDTIVITPHIIRMIEDFQKNGGSVLVITQKDIAEGALALQQFNSLRHPTCSSTQLIDFLNLNHIDSKDCLMITGDPTEISIANALDLPVIAYQPPNSPFVKFPPVELILEGFDEIDYEFLSHTYLHALKLPITIATTNRLLIRELSKEDASDVFAMYQDEAFQGEIKPYAMSVSETSEKLDAYMRNMYCFYGFGLWGVYRLADNTLIGHCGIEYKEIQRLDGSIECYPELSYAIRKSYWNQGYAKEACKAIVDYAFDQLEFDCLSVVIRENNKASQSLAKSLGFSCQDTITRSLPGQKPTNYLLGLRFNRQRKT